MFGMGFFEILVIAAVAIIFLGPEKLPQALVDIAKFFRAFKRTIDDAKDTLNREINLSQIKEEALAYKNSITQGAEDLKKEFDLKSLNLDEDLLDDKKDSTNVQDSKNPDNSATLETTKTEKKTLQFGENLKESEVQAQDSTNNSAQSDLNKDSIQSDSANGSTQSKTTQNSTQNNNCDSAQSDSANNSTQGDSTKDSAISLNLNTKNNKC